jgi:FkbM family methyltransferase
LGVLSYAQNLEDVVLARLLELVPAGVFVDVGAGHPVMDNVTYALYLAGWRGINVEPMPAEAQLLRDQRPEDRTIEVACGAVRGRVTLYEAPPENRGATTARADLVAGYEVGGQTFSSFDVDVVTLASLLDEYEAGSVHVVKIDVEGMEAEVVAGADLSRTRPWVLVIEATTPNTSYDSSSAWEPDVLDAGYVLTLFDGLNRFYVRDDLADVADLLSVPANVFDGWQRARDGVLIQQYQNDAQVMHAEVERLQAECQSVHARAAEEIAAITRAFKSAEEYARAIEADRERLRARCAELEGQS